MNNGYIYIFLVHKSKIITKITVYKTLIMGTHKNASKLGEYISTIFTELSCPPPTCTSNIQTQMYISNASCKMLKWKVKERKKVNVYTCLKQTSIVFARQPTKLHVVLLIP